MATVAAQITPSGIVAPSREDILAELRIAFQSIYGSDVVLEDGTQDGEWLGILAQGYYDCNQVAVAIYNAFAPSTSQGDALSSVVKINGLQRLIATQSEVTITIVGVAGTVINNGVVGDNLNLGTQWALPATVTIPGGGTIDVTATCTQAGAVAAAAGTLTNIVTPTVGWQSVTNAGAATLGAPVETDSALRQRQSASTAKSATSVIGSIYGEVANLANVVRAAAYDNDTGAPDANGIPAHSISIVVDGGDPQAICETIFNKKTPGTGTYGTTTRTVTDPHGITDDINYFMLAPIRIRAEITIKALTGYDSSTEALIKSAVAAFISALLINGDVYPFPVGAVAGLEPPTSATFAVTLVRLAKEAGAFGTSAIAIAFNEAATCVVADVTVIVT